MTAHAAQFQPADPQPVENFAGEDRDVALPFRGDTFLGVCEAIGQDLGINPDWLRIAFAPVILVSPSAAIAAYLGLGVVVALSRWIFPVERREPELAAAPAESGDDVEAEEERLAA